MGLLVVGVDVSPSFIVVGQDGSGLRNVSEFDSPGISACPVL